VVKFAIGIFSLRQKCVYAGEGWAAYWVGRAGGIPSAPAFGNHTTVLVEVRIAPPASYGFNNHNSKMISNLKFCPMQKLLHWTVRIRRRCGRWRQFLLQLS